MIKCGRTSGLCSLFKSTLNRGIIMPNVEVKCSVANCAFHAIGNVCGADKITIDMDYESKFDTEFSSELGFEARKEEANRSADTCCKTFKQKSE
jgi:hypothetical protein